MMSGYKYRSAINIPTNLNLMTWLGLDHWTTKLSENIAYVQSLVLYSDLPILG